MPMTQKAQGHQTVWANKLEKTAPRLNPLGAVAPKRLNIISCLLPGAYVLPRIAIAFGSKNAGPIPCSARQT